MTQGDGVIDNRKELKEEYSLSIRQIERITSINRGIVPKA